MEKVLMEKNKKKKRYFCDYNYGVVVIVAFLASSIVMGLTYFAIHGHMFSKYSNELNSYSEDTYQYLYDIADNVIEEGVGIKTQELPGNVVRYEIIGDNTKEIEFRYYLDNNKDMEYAPSASMTVILSNNYEIISKNPNYSSEEEYINSVEVAINAVSLASALSICMAFLFVILITWLVLASFSYSKKLNDRFS